MQVPFVPNGAIIFFQIVLFLAGVVYLLLIVGNLDNLLRNLGDIHFHTCFLIPIVAGCLLPFSWLGTPKDFWQAGVLAAITTTVGAVFIVASLGVVSDFEFCLTGCKHKKTKLKQALTL